MNENQPFDLVAYSAAVAETVERAGRGVAAVKTAGHRVTSGVIIREDLIAVNSHLLRREGAIAVHLPSGEQAQATLLGCDPSVDVGILQLSAAQPGSLLPKDSAKPRAGELAIVVGRTLDCGLSASMGIVGAVGGERQTWRGGRLERFIRLDVSLYPSQAGAAVVTAGGQFLGMATGAMSRHSTLAIPLETLNRVADELLKDGHIRRGYLGVGLQPVAIPENLRAKYPKAGEAGLMVLSIEPDASADKAGIQLGDILLRAGDMELLRTETLLRALRGDAVAKPLRFTILRAGQILEMDVTVSSAR
jgi:S1-C subfamily serine protease